MIRTPFLILLILSFFLFFSCEHEVEKVIDYSEYSLEDRITIPKQDTISVDSFGNKSYHFSERDTLNPEYLLYLEMQAFSSDSEYNSMSWYSPKLENKGRRTKYYVFHCTASKEGLDLDLEWFLDFFKYDRKWSRPGYTELLTLDGVWHEMYPNNYDGYTSYQEMTYGVKGINSQSMHFAYVGGVDKRLKPKDTTNNAQVAAIAAKIKEIYCFDPNAEIIFGHRDHTGVTKACPSFDLRNKFKDIL